MVVAGSGGCGGRRIVARSRHVGCPSGGQTGERGFALSLGFRGGAVIKLCNEVRSCCLVVVAR
jgi:hypothetical protein